MPVCCKMMWVSGVSEQFFSSCMCSHIFFLSTPLLTSPQLLAHSFPSPPSVSCVSSPRLTAFVVAQRRKEVETGNYCGRRMCPLHFFRFSTANSFSSLAIFLSLVLLAVPLKFLQITSCTENGGTACAVYEFYHHHACVALSPVVVQFQGWVCSCSGCLAVHWSRLYAD